MSRLGCFITFINIFFEVPAMQLQTSKREQEIKENLQYLILWL